MKHKLLLAADEKKSSLSIALYVAHACSGIQGTGVRIVLFHVLPRLPPHVEGSRAAEAAKRAELYAARAWNKAEQLLARLKERIVRAGISSESVITEIVEEGGDIPAQIKDAAARHRCDTIVVGRHEKSLIDKFLTSTVVERLLREPVGYTVWVVE